MRLAMTAVTFGCSFLFSKAIIEPVRRGHAPALQNTMLEVRLRETFFLDRNTFLLTISKLSDMILAQSTKAQTERAESELYPREMAVGASHGTGIRLSLPSRREENESE